MGWKDKFLRYKHTKRSWIACTYRFGCGKLLPGWFVPNEITRSRNNISACVWIHLGTKVFHNFVLFFKCFSFCFAHLHLLDETGEYGSGTFVVKRNR
jgi:hypothetical protein